MSRKMAIIIMGRPGSGKGTQAKKLAQELGFFHFETSKILKEYIAKESDDPAILQARKDMADGHLLETRLVARIVVQETKRIAKETNGIVYDGSPRILHEAEELFPVLVELYGKENIWVFNVEVAYEELRKRFASRLVCAAHGHVFSVALDGFSVGDTCPEDGSALSPRDLDDPKLFDTRMKEYETKTVPSIDYFRKHHSVIEINGERPIEEIFKDILGRFAR